MISLQAVPGSPGLNLLRGVLITLFFLLIFSATAQTDSQNTSVDSELPPDESAPLPALMSLAQSLALADTNHPDVIRQSARQQASQAVLERADVDNRWKFDLEFTARTAELQVLDRGYENDSRTKFIVSKMLWDFGKSAGHRDAANLGVESAQIGLDYARRIQRIQIIRHYLEVLAADHRFLADNESMTLAFGPFNRAQERQQRFGSVSELEVMKKRVAYFDELKQRNQSLRAQRASRLRLALAMGRPNAQPDGLIEPDLSAYAREIPDFDELLEKVLAASPVIRQANVELAQLKLKAAQAGKGQNPELYLDLQAADYAQDYRVRDRGRASLTLAVPLFAGSETAVEQAELLAEIAGKEADVLELDFEIREQVLEWVQQLEALAQEIDQNVQDLEYRELALDKSRLLYEMEVRAEIGRAQADMAKLLWRDAQAKYQRALIWEQIDAVLGATEVKFE